MNAFPTADTTWGFVVGGILLRREPGCWELDSERKYNSRKSKTQPFMRIVKNHDGFSHFLGDFSRKALLLRPLP